LTRKDFHEKHHDWRVESRLLLPGGGCVLGQLMKLGR
jgi:hypothetical protein